MPLSISPLHPATRATKRTRVRMAGPIAWALPSRRRVESRGCYEAAGTQPLTLQTAVLTSPGLPWLNDRPPACYRFGMARAPLSDYEKYIRTEELLALQKSQ